MSRRDCLPPSARDRAHWPVCGSCPAGRRSRASRTGRRSPGSAARSWGAPSRSAGATMAKYVAESAHVTLVTCTLGEEGEVLVPELEHLAADKEDRLGEHRAGELADAMQALGVVDHRLLGGPGRWRDSGMMGLPT